MNPASDHALQILDSLPALVWTSGKDARCNFFNKAWLEFTGRDLDKELGDGWTEGVHRGDLNDRLKTYLTAFRAREPYSTEFRLRNHDGSYQWIYEEGRPVFDTMGAFAGFLGHATDVTERKFSDHAVAEGARCLQLLSSLSPIAIFQTDHESNCLFANERWTQLTGISAKDSLGRGWFAAFHEDDRGKLETKLRSAFTSLDALNIECRLHNAEGAELLVYIQAALDLDEQGALRGSVGTITDLTNRSRTADETQKMARIESLENLASQVSHEFNNLLTPIILNLSVAQNQLHQPGYLHELRPRLKEAEEAAVRAHNLTHRLLAFGKGATPIKKAVDLKSLVEEASRFPLGGANDAIEMDIPDDIWAARVDPSQFNQIIVSLIANAAEAIADDGHIRVRATNIEDAGNIPGVPSIGGPHIRLEIEDDGSGITPGMMKKIFDPYFSTKLGHSGLGLTTALSIVRKHGGHLELKSTPGKGTVCTIYIEATGERAALKPRNEPEECIKKARGRILIMDDEELVRNSVRAILGSYGYEVETARDGEEALEIYADARDSDEPITITLMDLTIQGGMDGKDTIAELKALDPEAKAIVCSGASSDPIMVNFRDHGFNGAIRKPFHPDELNTLLTELIEA